MTVAGGQFEKAAGELLEGPRIADPVSPSLFAMAFSIVRRVFNSAKSVAVIRKKLNLTVEFQMGISPLL
jgi:hypothetical protein